MGTLGKLREKFQNKNSLSFADKLRGLQDKKHDDEKDKLYDETSNEEYGHSCNITV